MILKNQCTYINQTEKIFQWKWLDWIQVSGRPSEQVKAKEREKNKERKVIMLSYGLIHN